jgi:hypothetical protein
MDANAFGLNDKMVLGGLYSSTGWMVMSMYINTPNRNGVPGWILAGFYGHSKREDEDQGKNAYRRFNLSSSAVSGGLTYAFSDAVSVRAGASFSRVSLDEKDAALAPPDSGVTTVGFGPELTIRRSRWDGYFLSEQSLGAVYTYNLGIDSPSYHSTKFRVNYEQSLVPGFRLMLHGALLYQGDAGILHESSPSAVRINILPRSFSARSYMGFSGGFEKYLFKFPSGTLSLTASWEGVISEGPVLGLCWDQGIAGGLRFYLSRLAIPALGFGFGYNMTSGQSVFAFSMGMML